MKAVLLKQAGNIDNLILQDIAKPDIRSNEVLVKTSALSINPVDIKTRTGKALYGQLQNDPPIILGWDISGVVVAVGNEVNQFKEGDEVFGMVNFPGHGKAYAEYVAAPAAHLALKPRNISHQEAAAATLAPLTAWQVLVQQANIQAGQRVLIHAAAGGVGHYAVQIAKHLGAYVIGTASAANADFLKELGVDQHIDYRNENFEEVVNEVDIVLDPIGGETALKSLKVLKDGGRLVSIVGGAKEELLSQAQHRNILASNYLVQSSNKDMQELASLLEAGKIKSHISQQYAFDQIGKAHQQIETGSTRGKLVINIG